MNVITTDTQDALAQARMHTLAQRLAQATDEEQLRLHPLPKHAIAEEEEHLRRHYALLLAALLSAQAQVSESQSRLFMLLLDSMNLGGVRAALFEEARALQPEALIEAARLIRDEEWAEELLVDALVLLRLDNPLNEETAHLLGELAAFLQLDASTVQLRAEHVKQILGLREELHSEILAQSWPALIPYQLTTEDLVGCLDGGLWYLNDNLTAHRPWSIKNASLLFSSNSKIQTCMTNDSVLIENCMLFDPLLHFSGQGFCIIRNSRVEGNYREASQAAIFSNGIAVSVMNCNFSTKNNTSLHVIDTGLTAKGSDFIECGRSSVDAGAIILKSQKTSETVHGQEIEECNFERCIGHYAGAIHIDKLQKIKKCHFIDCSSSKSKDTPSLSINAGDCHGAPVIDECIFINSPINIGSAYFGMKVEFIKNTNFILSDIYYHNRYPNNKIESNCLLEKSKVIDKKIENI